MAVRYHLGVITRTGISGWALLTEDTEASVSVEVCVGSRVIATTRTGMPRSDVAAAHQLATDRVGFHLDVDTAVLLEADTNLFIADTMAEVDLSKLLPHGLASHLRSRLSELAKPEPLARAPVRGRIADGFFRDKAVLGLKNENAYLDYEIRRHHAWDLFTPGIDRGHALDWYLQHLNASMDWLPLAAGDIAYLNEVIEFAGKRERLSRATWSWLVDRADHMQTVRLQNVGDADWVMYDWSIHRAHELTATDCLVPQYYIDRLSVTVQEGRYPFSVFAQTWASRSPWKDDLDFELASHRHLIYLALILDVQSRPDLLRYFPSSVKIDAVLAASVDLMAAIGVVVTYDDVRNTGFRADFDVDSLSFLTLNEQGNRYQGSSAERGTVSFEGVQVVGPISKASGIGQAARLSIAALAAADVDFRSVDFTLGDPGNEMPTSDSLRLIDDPVAPRINLLHLNADRLPFGIAAMPDVFSNAYNIGYFFWELSEPADCHELAIDVVDEIWVATEYVREIYARATDKPVINVGMAVEIPEVDQTEARAALEEHFGLSSDDFTFVSTLDAFSYVQRKNPLGVLHAFLDEFDVSESVQMIVKVQNRSRVVDPPQLAIWAQIDVLVAQSPNITLVDEYLPYHQVLQLISGADAYVSLHRSEGLGLGILEAMSLGTPVVVTNYSGNVDFCDGTTAYVVDYDEVAVGSSDYPYTRPGHRWAEPDLGSAREQLRLVVEDSVLREQRSAAAQHLARTSFSADAIGLRYRTRIEEVIGART